VSTDGSGDVRDKRIISALVASRASRRFASHAASEVKVPVRIHRARGASSRTRPCSTVSSTGGSRRYHPWAVAPT